MAFNISDLSCGTYRQHYFTDVQTSKIDKEKEILKENWCVLGHTQFKLSRTHQYGRYHIKIQELILEGCYTDILTTYL